MEGVVYEELWQRADVTTVAIGGYRMVTMSPGEFVEVVADPRWMNLSPAMPLSITREPERNLGFLGTIGDVAFFVTE